MFFPEHPAPLIRVTVDHVCGLPSAADILVVLVHDVFNVLTSLLDMVGHKDSRHTSTDSQHFDLAVLWIL